MKYRVIIAPLVVIAAVTVLIGMVVNNPIDRAAAPKTFAAQDQLDQTVAALNQKLGEDWTEADMQPAGVAEPLVVLRRLSLALHGTIPSLEEIRLFESEIQQGVEPQELLSRWTERMLRDTRFADYFAERLARSLVGTEGGQFVVFRRDRFVDWLATQLAENRPWNEITREIIAQQGLWTGEAAVNFITAGVDGSNIDRNKLTGKTVRAFLGQRIDCAQCHDHPFDRWKQTDYEGLAAFYGQVNLTLVGIEDKPSLTFEVEDRETLEKRTVEPAVPFHPEWLPADGTLRERLAGWITHPDNRRFERAISNRVWALMFGTPWTTYYAVDDLPDPPEEQDVLDILGSDLREHNFDLRRLIHVIAASEPFRMTSISEAETEEEYLIEKQHWTIFPMVRLRPEQLIGSMLQASSVKTIDQNSHLISRVTRYFREQDFVRDYGDLGPDELDERAGTVTQSLLRMNGRLTREIIEASPLNSSLRVSQMSANDAECVENCYLICLSRRPSPEELNHFTGQLQGTEGVKRNRLVEDMYWSLFNALEFSWNH